MTVTIPLTTVTPVWTGDNDRKTSYLRATSFLGGLRFWTEALLRSLGETVCSATGEDRCLHNPAEGKHACPACRIFGCTGLGRSFGLKVLEDKLKDEAIGKVQLASYEKNGINKTPTWYLTADQAAGLVGNFVLRLSPMRPGQGGLALDPLLALALHLLLHWGMLGAKDQYGYGLVRPLPPAAFSDLWQAALAAMKRDAVAPDAALPSLRDFFFFSGELQDTEGRPGRNFPRDLPFEIRYAVRAGLRGCSASTELRHYFCGTVFGKSRQACKYNMGLDKNTLYGWGYFPRGGQWRGKRDDCLNLVKKKAAGQCGSFKWKEFASPRDTSKSAGQWRDFLAELANHPWR